MRTSSKTKSRRGTAAIVIGCMVLGLVAAAVSGWLFMRQAAQVPHPPVPASAGQQPAGHGKDDGDGKRGRSASDAFPEVDWGYWKGVNPDIVAWVTVPGTNIDYPVVRAPSWDPDWYLRHNVYGQWSLWGCPYVDADDARGLKSDNVVVYGHNMGVYDTSMFHDFAGFIDAGYAREHKRILVQTPSGHRVLEAQAATVIGGWQADKYTDFPSRAQFERWWSSAYSGCSMRLRRHVPALGGQTFTFVTCSYHFWDNERTLVYAL